MVYLTSFIRTFQVQKNTKQCRYLALKPLMMGSSSSSTITEVCTVLYCTSMYCIFQQAKTNCQCILQRKTKFLFQKIAEKLFTSMDPSSSDDFWNLREKIVFCNGNLQFVLIFVAIVLLFLSLMSSYGLVLLGFYSENEAKYEYQKLCNCYFTFLKMFSYLPQKSSQE